MAVTWYGCFQSSLKACLWHTRLLETEPGIESNIIKEFHPSHSSMTLISVIHLWQCDTMPPGVRHLSIIELQRKRRESEFELCLCVFMLMCMCPCVFTFVWRREVGFTDVLLLLPCSCYKALTVLLLQVYARFPPERIASVVFCTKAPFWTHKTLQAVEPNVEMWSTTAGCLQWNNSYYAISERSCNIKA